MGLWLSTPAWDVLAAAPALIVLAYSQDLDQTRIDASSVRLEAMASLDGGSPLPVSVAVTVPPGNPRALIIEPASALASGRYQVVSSGRPQTGLSSIGGERLGGSESDGRGDTVVTQFEVASHP